MKVNVEFLRLLIRLLVLLILFTMIFIIALFLYSTKFFPDIYNYINANITINRIQTLSELNFTVYEDFTTEGYTTTDFDYTDMTTYDSFDLEIQDIFNDGFGNGKSRRKRSIEIAEPKDYIDLPKKTVVIDYYFDVGDDKKIAKDLIEESELVENKDGRKELHSEHRHYYGAKDFEARYFCNTTGITISDAVYPSIATIFVKNETNDQFDYFCDGTLISEKHVITSARCVISADKNQKTQNFLLIFGKRSLLTMTGKEIISKISSIIIHDNFTWSPVQHDLAILELEVDIQPSPAVHPACLWPVNGQDSMTATTGWDVKSQLTAIYFSELRDESCTGNNRAENTVCATYSNEVATCPSYGGVLASKREDIWFVVGIQYGDPTYRGVCYKRNILYTDLNNYKDWIINSINV